MDKQKRIKELVAKLNEAAFSYYQKSEEIMSNLQYDELYDELLQLEKETGTVLSSSPTQKVGYEVLSELPKEVHSSPMLSLDKTKDREGLVSWLGDKKGILSWKLDGLTIALTYEKGVLVKALTRGNGTVGEVVTNNAKVFSNIPLTISHKGKVVLRGEAIITYSQFKRINEAIEDVESRYKNPRNLCSGSVRQLDPRVTKSRNVRFFAFSLVEAEGENFDNSRERQLIWLKNQGFDVVEYVSVSDENIVRTISDLEKKVADNDFPSDGLVLLYDDINYGKNLGRTSKFPRDSIAFKWEDQREETVLREVKWSASRTGLINPIAVFDSVELEGTTVSRASVHNLSMVQELKLGIGDKISVYKANMIIPQIAENMTKSNSIEIPKVCPVCQDKVIIAEDNGVKTLRCTNLECPAKHVKSFALFVSRDAMNIDGLSEATLEKFISRGIIKEFADLFKLKEHENEIVSMEGFGKKSFDNLILSAERAAHTTPQRLLYSLGISGIGSSNAKVITEHCKGSFCKVMNLTFEELTEINGIGQVMANSFVEYFKNEDNRQKVKALLEVLDIDETEDIKGDFLRGITFVITGSLTGYENRGELKAAIESAGGKVSGSVSAKTGYLINNDVHSASGKNKKALELGVEIIDEATITRWISQGEVRK
ncbi:MAG: NAD-dependent DNA ligase LigA [Hornefia sp.]|nr:NAD-dependent DNA ligase LigA [Hornefia sp.]